MKHFAIIAAAGPIDALSDVYDLRVYGKPKALLSLGEETVIERVTRQLDELGVECWVGIGKAGIEGWTEEFVREFRQLSCNILVSPSLTPVSPSNTGRFMLEHLQDTVAPDDRIIMMAGDFVFTDEALRELLQYPAPCIYGFMGEDDRCFILTGATIQDFLDESAPFESWGASIARFRELGFAYCVRGDAGHAPGKRNEGFAEIDFTYEWEAAKELVKEDNLCRVQETN